MILKDAFFSWDGVDLSTFVRSLELTYEAEEQDRTAMSDSTRKQEGGLKNWSITAEMYAEEGAGAPNAVLFPAVGNEAVVIVRPNATDPVSADNPNYTGTGLLTSANPVAGTVGEQQMMSVNIAPAGDLSRETA